ncbi:NRT1/ PTR family 6.4-like protein [Tanacetum coccineum]
MTTFSIAQATIMNQKLGSFEILATSFSVFLYISILLFASLNKRDVVPIAIKITRDPKGLMCLQGIGIRLILAVAGVVAETTICEKNRLEMNRDQDTRLSGFWLIPRYFLVGVAKAFAYVGQLVFFIIQAPERMCLDKAVIVIEHKATNEDRSNLSPVSTITQVEELKIVMNRIPIWQQGLRCLQRIGIGLILALAGMVAATAICEKDRLEMSRDQDTRLSGFWLIPRYFLVGVAEAFAYVDQLVFFITQAPERKKSMSKALCLSTLAMEFNAVIMTECKATNEDRSNLSAASTVTQVEEVKMVIKLIPIWTTAIKITRDPKGRKCLQRIGIGLILAVAGMVAATAICEKNRLETSRDQDTRLSGFWLIPRFLDKAVIVTGCKAANEDRSNLSPVSIVTQVEEVKIVIKLIPIWTTLAGMVATTAICEKNRLEMSQDQDTRLSGFWLIRRYFFVGVAKLLLLRVSLCFSSPKHLRG